MSRNHLILNGRGASGTPAHKVYSRLPSCEALEDRSVPATTLTAVLSQGLLLVEGTDHADSIVVRQMNNRLSVDNTLIQTTSGRVGDVAVSSVQGVIVSALDGNDSVVLSSGVTLPTVISGGFGDDTISGGSGTDVISGDGGSDKLYGGVGNDLILGGPGADLVSGNQGDDHLYGGAGTDRLYGGADCDSLCGGNYKDYDYLYGGPDADRYLTTSGDFAMYATKEDAVLNLTNGTSQWTDQEVMALDSAFTLMHQRTGNTMLLKDTMSSRPLTIVKMATLGDDAGDNTLTAIYIKKWIWYKFTYEKELVGYRRTIRIADWNESNAGENKAAALTMIHEIAHNWDSAGQIARRRRAVSHCWNDFLGVSKWTQTKPADWWIYNKSGDGKWWYYYMAPFAESYGRTNPKEDWTTCWEEYFDIYSQGGSLSSSVVASKLWILDTFFNGLR